MNLDPVDQAAGCAEAPAFHDGAFVAAGAFHASLADDLGAVMPTVWGTLFLTLLAGGAYAWDRHAQRRQHQRTKWDMYRRIRLGMWPGPGFAGARTLERVYGRRWARYIAKRVRPSLTLKDRWFGDPAEYSVAHGKAHRAWAGFRHTARSSFQENTLVLAPAQEGKSVSAVPYIWNAPGPVVVTSIRSDLLRASAGHRSTLGEIHTFNLGGTGTIGSTLKLDLIGPCIDFDAASRIASILIHASPNEGSTNAAFFEDKAAMALASYLHAAALVGGEAPGAPVDGAPPGQVATYVEAPPTMSTVRTWITTRDIEPYEILYNHAGANEAAKANLVGLFKEPVNTRGSVFATMDRCLRFLSSPVVEEALTPTADAPGLDFEQFLRSKDTLYLISPPSVQGSPTAPILAAFVQELLYAAMQAQEKRQLDPHLTAVLDEVCTICPIPLPELSAYSAGSGIQLHTFGQSWAQFIDRWGPNGAATIWNNHKAQIMWPTNSDDITKQRVIDLAGRIRIDTPQQSPDGEHQAEKTVDALTEPGAEIPNGHVLFRLRQSRPTIIKPPKYWKDKRAQAPLPEYLPPPKVYYRPEPMPELRGLVREERERDGALEDGAPEPPTGTERRSPDGAPQLTGLNGDKGSTGGARNRRPASDFMQRWQAESETAEAEHDRGDLA